MTPKKFEAVESPAGLAVEVAKKVNEKVPGVAAPTKAKLHELLTGVGEPATSAKLIKEDSDANAAAGLKKLSETVKNPAALPEAMRKDIHDKIFAVLAPVVTAGGAEFDFKADIDAIKAKLVPPAAPTTPAHGPAHGPAAHGDAAHGADAHAEGGDGHADAHATPDGHKSTELSPATAAKAAVIVSAVGTGVAMAAGAINGANTVGAAAGAAGGLSTVGGWISSAYTYVAGGLNSFAGALGLSTGSTATSSTLALLPSAAAPVAVLAGGWLASGRALRGLRRFVRWAKGAEQSDLAALGYNPLSRSNLAAPLTEGTGLVKDIWGMIFGKRDKEGKNGGLVPTIHGATTEPLLGHAGRTLVPKKGKLRNTLFGTVIGGALLGPVGLVAGYLGSNWYNNKPAASASADAGHAAAAHH